MRRFVNMNWGRSHVPHSFQRLELIWISISIFDRRFLSLFNGQIGLPQLCWLLRLGWLSYVKREVQSLSNTCLFGICPWSHIYHILLKYRCVIKISFWVRHVYLRWSNLYSLCKIVGVLGLAMSTLYIKWAFGRPSQYWHITQLAFSPIAEITNSYIHTYIHSVGFATHKFVVNLSQSNCSQLDAHTTV